MVLNENRECKHVKMNANTYKSVQKTSQCCPTLYTVTDTLNKWQCQQLQSELFQSHSVTAKCRSGRFLPIGEYNTDILTYSSPFLCLWSCFKRDAHPPALLCL
jgi:hypothetical protein